MIFSRTCEYALRAMAYLALNGREQFVMTPEIARRMRVPEPYIAKVFQGLVRAGLLESRRGPRGGFALRKAPEEISLHRIVQAVDDTALYGNCVMGLSECSGARPCALHGAWGRARREIVRRLRTTNLFQLAKQISRFRYGKLHRRRLSRVLLGRGSAR